MLSSENCQSVTRMHKLYQWQLLHIAKSMLPMHQVAILN